MRFTVFGRLEDSSRMQESQYVASFNDADGDLEIALRRQAIGVRVSGVVAAAGQQALIFATTN